MKIYIGSDHAGFLLKEKIILFLKSLNYDVEDLGTKNLESTDYPEYGKSVGEAVVLNNSFGIVICGTGVGISIAANKVSGVRCALCSEPLTAKLSRDHNDANVLALGGRTIGEEMAYEIVKTFLNTKFSNGVNHNRRINKLS